MDLQCDEEIFRDGESIAIVEKGMLPAEAVERWLEAVRADSSSKLDWHYSGGMAHMLHLGDADSRQRAEIALREHDGLDGIRLVRIIPAGASGLYRGGVTPVPEGAIAAAYEGGNSSSFIVAEP